MYVLQDCPVCFEDFDAERPPHTIPCGHAFCGPCLESLVSTSPTCPNCRVSYSTNSIRKVVCDSAPDTNRPEVQETEALMWQAIQSAIESPAAIGQRKSLVECNPEEAMVAAGMPANVLTALAIMRMLVQVEKRAHLLEDDLSTAQAVEQSLYDRISRLESQQFDSRNLASSRDLKLLMSDFQKLQSTMEAIDKKTSDIADRLKSEPAPPQPRPKTPNELSQTETPAPAPPAPTPAPAAPTLSEPQRPALLRKSPPQDVNNSPTTSPTQSRLSFRLGGPAGPQHHRYPSTPTPAKQLNSPPPTPAVIPEPLSGSSLFGQSVVTHRRSMAPELNFSNNPGRASACSTPMPNSPPPRYPMPIPRQSEAPSTPTDLTPTPTPTPRPPQPQPTPAQSEPHAGRNLPSPPAYRDRSPSLTATAPANSPPLPTQTPAPAPSPAPPRPPIPNLPSSRTLTALHAFSADSPVEHSFTQGEKLFLFSDSDSDKEWIWCKNAAGKTGYAPKSYVRVDDA